MPHDPLAGTDPLSGTGLKLADNTLGGTHPHPIEGDEDISTLWYCPTCGIVYFLTNAIFSFMGPFCQSTNHGIAGPPYTRLKPITPIQLKELQWKQKPSTVK